MLPVPAPGPLTEEDDSPTAVHAEAANDLLLDVPESGPQAGAAGTADPPSFDLVYQIARSHLPGALRRWGVHGQDLDDLIHDTALIASDGLPRFTPRCGPTPDLPLSLRAWLSAIGWRLASRLHARGHRRFELPQGGLAEIGAAEGSLSAEEIAAAHQRKAILADVVRKLRPERAKVLRMHVVEGMSVPDIAEELRLNPNTVKSRLARAREDAQALIARLGPDERRALKGGLLLLPFLYWVDAGDPAAPRPDPRSKLLRGAALAAGAAAMLAIGMAVGASRRGPARHAAEEVAIVAAVDRDQPEDVRTVRAVSAPADVPAKPAPSSTIAGIDAKSGSTAREKDLLRTAQRALMNHERERAQVALSAHAAEFPRGELASVREALRAQLRALTDEY